MTCIKCSAELPGEAIFCSQCGSPQVQEPQAQPQPTSSQPTARNYLVWGLVLLVGLFGFVASNFDDFSARSNPTTPTSQATTPISEPEIWYPSGFEELTESIAYKSFPKGTMDCGYSSPHSCYQIYVETKYSCELFIRVNFLVDGVVVDDALDSARVAAGEQAVLSFASFKSAQYEGSKKVKFTEATCY